MTLEWAEGMMVDTTMEDTVDGEVLEDEVGGAVASEEEGEVEGSEVDGNNVRYMAFRWTTSRRSGR